MFLAKLMLLNFAMLALACVGLGALFWIDRQCKRWRGR